jgi:hypothetical protein
LSPSQLPLAPDQRGVEAPSRGHGRHGNEPPRGHGLSLALQRQSFDGVHLDRVSSQAQGRLAEQGLTGLCGLLQPRGNVHGVTRRAQHRLRARQSEDRHHGVTDELLDDAAMALDDRLHALEIAGEQGAG